MDAVEVREIHHRAIHSFRAINIALDTRICPRVLGRVGEGGEAPEVQSTCMRDLRRAVEVRGIHHRAIHSFRAIKGDSAEFSAEV
ncbi:hypothetical protein Prudu_002919 [Prunus dulcis]|uniref:Uncharacterized protein n=1 Tax=Prunus dulcis TaxID=3755 RepID=A0A4Y1QRV4_PRUDU|nr:hypothetical protein Prudu_002919 [Prunus dulcis]